MTPSLLSFVVLGCIIIAVGWLPLLLRPLPLSLPMVAVGFGALFFWGMPSGRFALEYRHVAELLTNVVLIVAVMGAGLKIDRPFSVQRWASTWRLLGIVMPVSITAIAACAVVLLGAPLGLAILFGGMLAPTDPVLASSVQVAPPGKGDKGEVHFALTSEAGLNDGLAFPFVSLGLLIMHQGADPGEWLGRWLLVDVLWKAGAAVALGAGIGWGLVAVNRRLPERFRLAHSRNGIISLGVTFLVYGLSEITDCYGFVAVFVSAVTIRNTSDLVEYHRALSDFAEQVERTTTVLVLALFGGVLVQGVFSGLTWADAAFAGLVLLAVRPAATFLGFIGSGEPMRKRVALGYFGIRGLGSLYYAIYAGNRLSGEDPSRIWEIVALVVLVSVVLYGTTTDLVMRCLGLDSPERRAFCSVKGPPWSRPAP